MVEYSVSEGQSTLGLNDLTSTKNMVHPHSIRNVNGQCRAAVRGRYTAICGDAEQSRLGGTQAVIHFRELILPTTHATQINADLLSFIRAGALRVQYYHSASHMGQGSG